MANPDNTVDSQAPDRTRRHFESSFIAAFAGFLLLNWGLSLFAPFNFDPYKFSYKGWAWWMMNDLRRSSEVYNIALLGSSVMVSAIDSCDANWLNKSLDLTRYHRASYLDHKLRTTFGGSFNTFNLAAPGQMPSDAYLSLRAMVNCAHRPEVVIYGVFPRDFIDSTLSTPADTEPFRYLRRLVNIDDVYAAVFRSFWNRLDWWLGRTISIYGQSLDFQMSFVDVADKFLAWAVPRPYNNPPFTWWDRVRLLPNYLPGEIHAEAVMTVPVPEEKLLKTWVDNTHEYQQRYKHPDPWSYKTQINFLRALANFCHKERIELIVVNMPITPYNVGMLQPGIYMRYLQAMREEAIRSGFTYYDLCDFVRYKQSDYNDSVHLNPIGGRKLIDHLVECLAADRRTSSAMAMVGQDLARQKALAASRNGILPY